jgi:hypothetical protein
VVAGTIYKEFVHYAQRNQIGDEVHYLFSCDHFNDQRKLQLYIKQNFRNRLNTFKFKELMTSNSMTNLQTRGSPEPVSLNWTLVQILFNQF